MKRTSYPRFLARAAMTLLAVFCFLGARAQTTVEIGDGNSEDNYTPIGTLYNYSITEQLYTAEEIGMAGTISSISFYYVQTDAKDFPITVYMANVDAANLSTGISLADAEPVFDGTLSVTGAGWATITLDTPFAYDGTSNLLIGINKGYVKWFSNPTWRHTEVANMTRYTQNDNTAYDTSTVPANVTNKRPNIQIEITPSGGVTVERPATFTVSDITGYGATLSWTGGTGTYNLELKEADGEFEELEYGTTATSIELDELAPNTAYSARIQSVSGSDVSSWKNVSFTTLEVCPDGKICIGAGTATNDNLPSNNFYKQSLTQQIYTAEELGEEGFILSLDLFKANTIEMVRNLDIYVVSTDKDEFESKTDWIPVTAADLVFSGEVTFTDNDWTTIEFENPFEYNGESNIAIVIDDNTGSYKNTTSFYAFTAEKNQALYYRDDSNNLDPTAELTTEGYLTTSKNRIRLVIGEPPAVLKPSGLTVNYEGGLTAEVSWTSEEKAFDIEVNGKTIENVSNPFILEDLELATTYEVRVCAKNDDGVVSEWTSPVSFTTDMCMPEDQCVITFALTDSYGDGWNGNAIQVVDVLTGTVLGTLANQNTSKKVEDKEKAAKEKETKLAEAQVKGAKAAETETYTFSVCNGREIQFVWVKGSYANETSWVIKDINDEVICEGTGTSNMATGDVLASYTVDCAEVDARKPTDLAATEIGPRSAKLSWTENSIVPATKWVVSYSAEGESTSLEVNVNPYTLDNLTPETTYTVKVRPETGENVEKWSDEITFTTAVAFPAPTALTVSDITATSANVSWEGEANSYNLRYMETDAPSMATIILNADDVWGDGSGYQMLLDADATAFGTVIPETGALTSSGDADASVYAEFEYKIPENADGALTTTNMVSGASVSIQVPAGTYDWCITNPTPDDKMWIASEHGNVGGRYDDYEFEAGKTYEFHVYLNGENDATDVTITDSKAAPAKDGKWTVVENATSPYALEDLTPDTYYTVEVQGVYTGEYVGESKWASKTFKTLELYPAPTDLEATEVSPYSAELSWTENGTAEEWVINIFDNDEEEETEITATENPFTITGLTPGVEYVVKVRPAGDNESWSNEIIVMLAFAAPTEVAADNITSSTAEISWNGNADATTYNLRYRVASAGGETLTDFDDSSLGEWTTIDADGDEYTWVLGSQVGGVYLVEGASLAGSGHESSADMVVSGSYSNATGSALTPDNYLVSPQVALGGSISFWAAGQDGNYAAEHFGVAVSTTSNTDATAFTTIQEWTLSAKAQGNWYQYTADLSAYAGQQGYVAIRHFGCTDQFMLDIDDIVIEEPGETEEEPWTVVEDVASPYTIEGLDPETKYEVEVQAVYVDGQSEWAGTTFTTIEDNPVPYDIEADLVADGGTITWSGEGDSYNLRYRTAANQDMLLYQDFEGGLGDWTTENLESGSTVYTGIGVNSSAAFAFKYTQNPPQYLISPEINGDTEGTLLAFYYACYDSSYPETFMVGYSTTTNAVDAFTWSEETTASSTSGDYYTQELPAGVKYIAIQCTSNNMYYLFVDEIGIYGDYTPGGDWQTVTVTEPTAILSGLDTNNGYEYQIQSVKDGETSEWSEVGEFALLTLQNNKVSDGPSISNLLLNNYGRQAHVTFAGRTLFQDGAWNTLTLPFDVDDLEASPLAGATVKSLTNATVEGNHVTLTFDEYPLYGGYPYIIKWESGSNIENPAFANVVISASSAYTLGNSDVKFVGYFDPIDITPDDDNIYYMTGENTLKHTAVNRTLKSCRAYFELSEAVTAGGVREFTLNFGDNDATGIVSIDNEQLNNESGWYTVDGKKLDKQPKRKGVYINNGIKVVIK